MVGVSVAVGDGVTVAVGVSVGLGVNVAVGVVVAVGVSVGVIGVGLSVLVGVSLIGTRVDVGPMRVTVIIGVAVAVGVVVLLGVNDGVCVAVLLAVCVGVGVNVGVLVDVAVGVCVAVGVGEGWKSTCGKYTPTGGIPPTTSGGSFTDGRALSNACCTSGSSALNTKSGNRVGVRVSGPRVMVWGGSDWRRGCSKLLTVNPATNTTNSAIKSQMSRRPCRFGNCTAPHLYLTSTHSPLP